MQSTLIYSHYLCPFAITLISLCVAYQIFFFSGSLSEASSHFKHSLYGFYGFFITSMSFHSTCFILTLMSGSFTGDMLTCSTGEQKRTTVLKGETFFPPSLFLWSVKNQQRWGGLWGNEGMRGTRIEGEIKTEDKNKSHGGAQENYHFEQLTRFPGKQSARKNGSGRGMGHRTSQ